MEPMELKVDSLEVLISRSSRTGIYVRAKYDDKWGNYDISLLDRNSLIEWLKSRPDNPEFVINVVLSLLGHDQIK